MEIQPENLETKKYVAKTISGLEEVLAEELVEMGAANVEVLKRAVSFDGDLRMLYKANYCLRTAQRVLSPLYSFELADEDDLYNEVNKFDWENHLELHKTLAVDAFVTDSEITHSHFAALRTKDAIVDRFRTVYNGRRPSVDTENPDFRINIHINGSNCNVSLDSSGASLHKRGYRVANAEAPLSEVLAAGLIRLSGWDKNSNFIDPMCGSGTLLIEAAMYANNIPAGSYREKFAFMNWKNFDSKLWNEVKDEALEQQTEFEHQIIGSDISPKNLAAAKANVKAAKMHKDIYLYVEDCAETEPPQGNVSGTIIINPPYGERIKLNDIVGLYKGIGDVLKKNYTGYNAWVISSDQKALSLIGLRPSRKFTVFNGQLECKYVHFDLYRGSKKELYESGEIEAFNASKPKEKEKKYKEFQRKPSSSEPRRNFNNSERDNNSERKNTDRKPFEKREHTPFEKKENFKSRERKTFRGDNAPERKRIYPRDNQSYKPVEKPENKKQDTNFDELED
mgnify:CR=1 FL=1